MDNIPPEILRHIMKLSTATSAASSIFSDLVQAQYRRLCLVSQYWQDVARPLLYLHPMVDSEKGTTAILLRALEGRPDLAKLVRLIGLCYSEPQKQGSTAFVEATSLALCCPNLEAIDTLYGFINLVDLLVAAPKLRTLSCFETQIACVSSKSRIASFQQLESFKMHATLIAHNTRYPVVDLPGLRNLSLYTTDSAMSAAFCSSLHRLVNLEVKGEEPLWEQMSRSIATCTLLENLCISIAEYEELQILSTLKNTEVASITLVDVKETLDVVKLLDREEPALSKLKSLKVYSHSRKMYKILGAVQESTVLYNEEQLGSELKAVCAKRGIAFLGCSSNVFWCDVAPGCFVEM